MIQSLTSDEVDAKILQPPGAVVVDFYQASCPPCRVLEPRLARVAQEYRGRVQVYRVDLDRDMPVAQRFQVMSLPTILVVRGGREVERLDGLITEQALRAAFDRAVQD